MTVIPDSLTQQASNPVAGSAEGQTLPPPPSSSALPIDSRTTPPSPQPVPPIDRHAALGRFITNMRSAIEGTTTQYDTDPSTGTVIERQVPRKPGAFFRDLVSGALSGMAAASMAPPRGGAAGLGLGFEGARESQQLQQDRTRQQVQRNATAMQQRQQAADQNQFAQALIAQKNISDFHLGLKTDFHNEAEHRQFDQASKLIKQFALDNHGFVAPDIAHNGEPGNGPALKAAIDKDALSVMQGPEGYHRIPVYEFNDTRGLTRNKDGQWIEEDGSPADWNKHSTVSLIDVPVGLWSKTITLTRAQANAIAGKQFVKGDPNGEVSAPFGSLYALGLKNTQALHDARNELYRAPQSEQEALALQAEAKQINADPNAPADLKRRAAIKGPMADSWLTAQAAQKAADRTPPKQSFEEQTFDEWKQTHPNGTRLQFQNEQARGKKAAELQAEQNATFGGSGSGKSGPDFIKTLPAGLQSQVKAFGEGRLDLSATPRGKEKTALIQALTQAYPDFDQTKGQTWGKTRNEYMGAGQTAKKVVSYNTALEHMQDLYDHSTFEGLYLPGSKDYSDRSVALHYVSNEVGNAIKTGIMTEKEGAEVLDSLKGWTPGTAKERTAETARLLHDKIDEYQRKFQEAAPSQSIQAPILISPKAARAYDHTQGIASAQQNPPPGATMKVPGSDGQLHWSDGHRDLGVVR